MPEGSRLGTYYSGADSCLVWGAAVVRAERAEPHDAVDRSGVLRFPARNFSVPFSERTPRTPGSGEGSLSLQGARSGGDPGRFRGSVRDLRSGGFEVYRECGPLLPARLRR